MSCSFVFAQILQIVATKEIINEIDHEIENGHCYFFEKI